MPNGDVTITRQRRRRLSPSSGVPVDWGGGWTRDPTENVLDKVAGEVRRIDDLMAARAALMAEQIKRLDAIQNLEARHANEMQRKESERLDAIRAVDVQAVQRAAEVAEIRATTLAGQVAAAAEANRASVAATAVALETKLNTALEPLTAAIGELRRTQFEQQGQKIERAEQRTVTTDSKSTSQWMIALVIGAVVAAVQIALHFVPAAGK